MDEQFSFVTFFTKEYLIYGLTLIDSILRTSPNSTIFVLPIDPESELCINEKYSDDSHVEVVENSEILKLLEHFMRSGRTKTEALFTLKPRIIRLAIQKIKLGKVIFYCDADLFFYRDIPSDIMLGKELLISRHLFRRNLVSHLRYGRYNAGFVGIRNSKIGMRALSDWEDNCFLKCSMIPDELSFADQKYLERFETFENSVKVLSETSFNQSLWIFQRKSELQSGPILDKEPLICFHFHGLRAYANCVDTGIDRYQGTPHKQNIYQFLYKPYIEALRSNLKIASGYLMKSPPKGFNRFKRYRFVDWKIR